MAKSVDIMPVCDRKYYGVFAIRRDNPNDILGYVENSFSMGWSKYFVSVNEGFGEWRVKKATDHWIEDSPGSKDSDKDFTHWFKHFRKDLYREGMTVEEMHKAYYDDIYAMHCRSLKAQSVWNNCFSSLNVPVGYDVKVFRLNSKRCPVEVDMRYRAAYDRRRVKDWNKWRYRNALFAVKALNPGEKSLINRYPTLAQSMKFPPVQTDKMKLVLTMNTNTPYATLKKHFDSGWSRNVKPTTRSERKVLKKQRRNSFAKEGSRGR